MDQNTIEKSGAPIWEQLAFENQSLSLHNKPEGRTIVEKIEAETRRRINAASRAISESGIDPLRIIVKPPITERTDLGYLSDVDLITFSLLDSDLERLKTACGSQGLYCFIGNMSSEDLAAFPPEAQEFFKTYRSETPVGTQNGEGDFDEIAEELEEKSRGILNDDERHRLVEVRKGIAELYIGKLQEFMPVVASNLSGSTVEKGRRLSPSSDIDIDVLLDTPENVQRCIVFALNYLNILFAQKFSVKIDLYADNIESIRDMAKRDEGVRNYYNQKFSLYL